MEELKNKYVELEEAFKEKYKDIIANIAIKNNVDLGVGYDMLKANARGGDYACDLEYSKEELIADYLELEATSKAIGILGGIIQ